MNRRYDVILNKDIVLKSDVKNLKFSNIIESIPVSFPFKFGRGNFEYNLLLIIPRELGSLKLKGQIALLYSSLSFYKQHIRDLSITSNINAVIFNTKAINLMDTSTELYINGIQCLKAKANGVLAFNKTDDSSLTISIEDINKYFFNLFYDGISANIYDLKANGKIDCRFAQSEKSFIKGEINVTKAVFEDNSDNTDSEKHTNVTGNLNFNVIGTEKDFNIDNFNLSLYEKQKEIVQFDVSGNFPVPLKSGKANLSITSNRIILDEIIPIYKHLNRTINRTFAKETDEYDPIDFKGLNLDGDIRLNCISYGKLLNSNLHSKLILKNNRITLNQEKSQISGTDVKYHGELETNHKNGYPFGFNASFSNLDLKPFIKTFVPGNYKHVGGMVNLFSMSLQGKGFSKENINKNLTGNLNMELSELSMPYQINKYSLLKFLLSPLLILEQSRELLPGGFLIENFEKGIQSTKKIMNNLDNINLKSGVIKLSAKHGKINFDKVAFIGEEYETIHYSNFYGTMNYDGTLDIYSKSNIAGTTIPFYIEGTIENPTPDFSFFIPSFLFWNIIIIPVKIFDLVIDISIGVYRTVVGGACTLWYLIASPFIPDDTEKIEEKKEQNTVENLLKH